ncbi:MAG: hypothetical protein MJ176_04945 [Treponema sp.]|nr:hypothetical protein [Treponema sp.]
MKCGSIADNKVDDLKKTFNDIEDDYVKSLLKHGSGTFKELNEYETTFRHLVFTGICDYYGLVYTKKEI